MSKKQQRKKAVTKKPFNWKKDGKWLAIFCILLVVTGYFYVTGENKSRIEHDLSVLGNGKPTVVQIHDPGCQLCRRLQSSVNAVKSDFEPAIQFKTANIKTSKGADFAEKYNAPHVTLLLFDGTGKHVNTLSGVQPKEAITEFLQDIL